MFKKIGGFFVVLKNKIGDFLFYNRFGTVMAIIGVIVAFWDLTTKFLFDEKTLQAIPGFFGVVSSHNTGGAWSMFSDSTILLIVFTIIFIIAIVVFNYFLKAKNYFYAISMGLLLGGAICNLYDRIKFGYVRDFINLEFMRFPIFNIADIAITVGVILLCVYFVFIMPKLQERKKLQENANNNETVAEESLVEQKVEIMQEQKVDVEQKNKEIEEKETKNRATKSEKTATKSKKSTQTGGETALKNKKTTTNVKNEKKEDNKKTNLKNDKKAKNTTINNQKRNNNKKLVKK